MRVRFYDIKWDTDGENPDLPVATEIVLDDRTNVLLEGADVLSDQYGWCVSSFGFEIVKEDTQ
jgi:hypothetical protein